MKKYIIAVDFDGTLCVNKYPDIGEPNRNLFKYLIDKQRSGCQIILWTCRSGKDLEKAIEFCKNNGLIFDYVNENTKEIIESFGRDTRKIFANEYIDDKHVSFTNVPFHKY